MLFKGYGVLSIIVFIIVAISSGIIRSKLANNENSTEISILQPVPVVVAQVPPTFVLSVPQPTLVGDSNHPQSYNQFYSATKPPSIEAQGYLPSTEDTDHSTRKSEQKIEL